MNMQRNYAGEVFADVEAGCKPNLITAQRAVAQGEALRAINAELLKACEMVLDADGDLYAIDFDMVRAAIAKATS